MKRADVRTIQFLQHGTTKKVAIYFNGELFRPEEDTVPQGRFDIAV